jgi:hypothetical protein
MLRLGNRAGAVAATKASTDHLEVTTYPSDFFKPLNERVPVYQKPFRLLQELVLEVTPQAEAAFRARKELMVGGTLEYQACDDKVCFNPVALPLTWTLAVTPNITERLNRPR